jgi:hypothetical protein
MKKKISIVLVLAFLSFGCGQKATTTVHTDAKPVVSDEKKFAQWFMETMKTEGHYDDCVKFASPSCSSLLEAVLVQRERIDNADTCKAAYDSTIDKKLVEMTNRENQQVAHCKALLMYPVPKSEKDEGYRAWWSENISR